MQTAGEYPEFSRDIAKPLMLADELFGTLPIKKASK
jgi:hypothetical protein